MFPDLLQPRGLEITSQLGYDAGVSICDCCHGWENIIKEASNILDGEIEGGSTLEEGSQRQSGLFQS
jgi:hypothetical protein